MTGRKEDYNTGPAELTPSPFIKKRNLEWRISSPPLKRRRPDAEERVLSNNNRLQAEPSSAAIEAREAQVADHSAHFSQLLSKFILSPFPSKTPRLSISSYKTLFDKALGNPDASHFVIHQHDHPIAGTHYDLRLQINGTSSASWAIMYGLPGDPNSKRPSRNATETRIHCLGNHLVETASRATGSLLIWDTGSYEVLPRETKQHRYERDSDEDDGAGDSDHDPTLAPAGNADGHGLTQQQKLHVAFAARKIRLRLHGTRLPQPYVVNLRLTKQEDAAGRSKAITSATSSRPKRRRRANGSARGTPSKQRAESTSDSESHDEGAQPEEDTGSLLDVNQDNVDAIGEDSALLTAMERELRELEDGMVRETNAYQGASNTIGSVHQRRWYLSLDKAASGFVRRRGDGVWEKAGTHLRADPDPDPDPNPETARLEYPFYVRGSQHERSVVTGRLGSEVLEDEGVVGFVARKGWRPVVN